MGTHMYYNKEWKKTWKIAIINIYLTQEINIFDAHKPNPYFHYVPIIIQRHFKMSSLTEKMGGYDSTTNVSNLGLCLFNAYGKNNFKLFIQDMTEYYVEEEKVKILLTY